jgi:hypothetical protein
MIIVPTCSSTGAAEPKERVLPLDNVATPVRNVSSIECEEYRPKKRGRQSISKDGMGKRFHRMRKYFSCNKAAKKKSAVSGCQRL